VCGNPLAWEAKCPVGSVTTFRGCQPDAGEGLVLETLPVPWLGVFWAEHPPFLEGRGLGAAKPDPRAPFHCTAWGLQAPLSSSFACSGQAQLMVFIFTLRKLLFRVVGVFCSGFCLFV